jgi:hypothetical protein
MGRPLVITVRAKTNEEMLAAAQAKAQALTEAHACERLLVVYGPDAARVYVEGAKPVPQRRQRPSREDA